MNMAAEHDDPKVIAYRLTQVEGWVRGMDSKLDKIIEGYPTMAVLSSMIAPLNREIKELKDEKNEERKERSRNSQQVKIAIYAAIASPVATFVVAKILGAL